MLNREAYRFNTASNNFIKAYNSKDPYFVAEVNNFVEEIL